MCKEYNGHTNKQTWLIALWIDENQLTQQYWVDQAGKLSTYDLSDALRQTYDDHNPHGDQASVWSDLMGHALALVNWDELARGYKQTAIEWAEYNA